MSKITSLLNPKVKELVKLRTESKFREQQDAVLVAGRKLVEEVRAKSSPLEIYSTSALDAPHTLVTEAVMKKITGLTSPEGIAATFSLPKEAKKLEGPLLVLDRVSDPGNMGTLMRTALALGWGGLYFLPGCVDPFHEKVMRASRATLFELSWQQGDWKNIEKQVNTLYVADLDGTPLNQVKPDGTFGLIVGNEAQGVSKEALAAGERITIPMRGEMESLNVAISGGIIMYTLGQKIG